MLPLCCFLAASNAHHHLAAAGHDLQFGLREAVVVTLTVRVTCQVRPARFAQKSSDLQWASGTVYTRAAGTTAVPL